MSKLLHIVCDYGVSDPAFAEVTQRLLTNYPDVHPLVTPVPSFNTISTGFWIYQYALGEHPKGMMIFSNTAPRKDKKEKRQDNAGEKLLYAKLKNGVEVVAVNAGHCFSFIKPHIEKLCFLDTQNKGSQFSSRDFYPLATARVAKFDPTVFKAKINPKLIPDVPSNRIAWIDGYGNIKTTARKSNTDLNLGDKIQVVIEGVVRTATVYGGSFSVSEGELACSYGSSGYDDPFIELFLRGGNAFEHFGNPSLNSEIEFIR